MKRIALIGAFDRNNYGDVLMPIVFKKVFGNKNYEYECFGLIEADLSYCGGEKCKGLNDFYHNLEKFDVAVLVGGECIGSDYSTMLLSIVDSNQEEMKYKRLSFFFPFLFNIYARKKLNGLMPKPWVIKSNNKMKIIYNTVGGHLEKIKYPLLKKVTNSDLQNCKNEMAYSNYISVRDDRTFKYMNYINGIKKYPDSITIISRIYDNEWFDNYIKNEELQKFVSNNKFVCMQMNYIIGNKLKSDIVSQIKEFYIKNKVKIFLLPLGYAHAHNDQLILKKIYNQCQQECVFFEFLDIYESMYVISKSSAYIGTSLHGAITSISYKIPHTALSIKSKKLIRYLNTWDTTKIKYAEVDNISHVLTDLINNTEHKKYVAKKSDELIELCVENNKEIKKVLDYNE